MRILIVEDEALIAEGIELTLASTGHNVVGIARDFGEALDLAQRHDPEMAFVDIKLADGSSGLDVARELKELGVACVFATANPPDPLHGRDLCLGYILKPFTHRLLVQTAEFVGRLHTGGNSAPLGFNYF